jgi:capsular exopolysaccharide synthesis family protein
MEDYNVLHPAFEQEEAVNFDYGKYLRGLWKRKWLLAFLTLAFAAFFYSQIRNQIPIYQAEVFLKTKEFDNQSGQILSRSRQIEMATENFTKRVVARLGLALDIKQSSLGSERDNIFQEFHTTENPVPGDYKVQSTERGHYLLEQKVNQEYIILDSTHVWDAVQKLRTANGFSFRLHPHFVTRANYVEFKIQPFSRAMQGIRNLDVIVNRKTGRTMRLIKTGRDPQKLADDLNRIAEAYVRETLKLMNRDEIAKLRTLQVQLEAAEANMRQTEAELRTFHYRYPISIEAEKSALATKLLDIETELIRLPRIRSKLADLLDRLEREDQVEDPFQYRRYIVNQLANFQEMRDDPNLGIYRERLRDLLIQYDDMIEKYSSDYPAVVETKTEINKTQNEIITFATTFLNTLTKNESEYRAQKKQIEEKLQKFPEEESRLQELQNRKAINQRLYNDYLAEIQKLKVADAAESGDIEILDPAVPPKNPINPSKKQKVLMGGALGFFLGAIISIALDFLDKRFRSIQEVERELDLKVIGNIPRINFENIQDYQDFEKVKQIDRQLVTHDYSPTPIGEAYRALRTQLLFSKKSERIHNLVINSIGPEEGKSFTVCNLGIILAQQKSNTLIVDSDLRRGVLHNTFKVSKQPGLTNYLTNNAILADIVQKTTVPNLSIVSCGAMMPNPSELLGSLQMRRFIEETKRKFDFIIFDTPPLEAATDAAVLSTQVDAIAMVIMANITNKKMAKEKLEMMNSIPTKLVGVIYNGSDSTLIRNQYSYYHY